MLGFPKTAISFFVTCEESFHHLLVNGQHYLSENASFYDVIGQFASNSLDGKLRKHVVDILAYLFLEGLVLHVFRVALERNHCLQEELALFLR